MELNYTCKHICKLKIAVCWNVMPYYMSESYVFWMILLPPFSGYPEDGGSSFIQNKSLTDYMVSHIRIHFNLYLI